MSGFPTLAKALDGHREDYESTIPSCECGWEQGDDSGVGPFWRDHADALWLEARTVRTAKDLAALPAGTVVRSKANSIACHFGEQRGVVFGDDRPFNWGNLRRPVVVLEHPEWSAA